jgi:hypothetical protein
MREIERINSLKQSYKSDLNPEERIDIIEECENTEIQDTTVYENSIIYFGIREGIVKFEVKDFTYFAMMLIPLTMFLYSIYMSLIVIDNPTESINHIYENPFVWSILGAFIALSLERILLLVGKILSNHKYAEAAYDNRGRNLRKELIQVKESVKDDIIEEYTIDKYKEENL